MEKLEDSLGSARNDWTQEQAARLYDASFNDLLYAAATVHRRHFDPNEVQRSQLLNIKTGGCPEDCAYCSQSARYSTEIDATRLMSVPRVLDEARKAKAQGATRYCMGAAWRQPKSRDLTSVVQMIQGVKALGLETCMTLGMLTDEDAGTLKQAGLDFYNHNIDTSESYYGNVITTRKFSARIETLDRVRIAGIKVCCGGIIGMGETAADRISMLVTLANLPEHPESVPINMLIPMQGTPLADTPPLESFEFIRTIATARIMMPQSVVRLSAGRSKMSEEMQALCFFAGANSIFCGSKLLTAANPEMDADAALFAKLGLKPAQPSEVREAACVARD